MAALQLQVEGRPRTEVATARASERTAAVAGREGGRERQEQGEAKEGAAKEGQEQGEGEEGLAAAAGGGEGGVAVFHEDSVEARLDDLEEQVSKGERGQDEL